MSHLHTMLIRADATSVMGTGHLMRCLALAQVWQTRGGQVIWLTHELPLFLQQRLRTEGMEGKEVQALPGTVEDAAELVAAARQNSADVVVIDGYHFDASYQKHICQSGKPVLWLDDYGHAASCCAQFILNQNVCAHAEIYPSRSLETQLLLGSAFVLLRREFEPWRCWFRTIEAKATRLLVTMGGVDSPNVTQQIAETLLRLASPELDVTFVLGGGYGHEEGLRSSLQTAPFRYVLRRQVTNMPQLMAWADVAISASGSSCWELCFMALPTLTVILADNQEPIATRLAEMGVTKNLGWHTALTTEKIGAVLSSLLDNQTVRQEMSHRGRNLVDGLGSQRVAAHLSGSYVQLRPATEADSLRLFEWVNEPTVRQASFHSAPIPWTQHLTWLQRKLDDTNCQIYIGENIQGQAVGQVRFEAEGAEAVISVSLAPVYRGKGYGVEFIAAATLTYTRQTTVTTIHAYIKQDNNASRRAFLMAGYVEMAPTDIHHTPAWHLTWRCPDAPFHL